MTSSTVLGYLVVLLACGIVAKGQRCGYCFEYLGGMIDANSYKLTRQGQNLDEIKTQVKSSIPSELTKLNQAIENLKAALPTGSINSQLQNQTAALEVMKQAVVSMASQVGRQTLLQELQSASIKNVTSQLRKQDVDLEEVKTAIANIFRERQKLSEDLATHDSRLQEHDHLEKKSNELIKDIYEALLESRDCSDVAATGQNSSGIYRILPGNVNRLLEFNVFCDLSRPDGGWLVFQRREDGSVNFERTWNEYKLGFGDPTGEFWLGNQLLHILTSNRAYKLRIELEDFDGEKRVAEYMTFFVASEADSYRLTVGGYSGNAGDSFSNHTGSRFSTKDADNDKSKEQCSLKYRGAWWYRDCHTSNLNGAYLAGPHTSYADGIEWQSWHGYYYSLKSTEMKIAALD